jgi:membrane-associated phospholipid phosphatase
VKPASRFAVAVSWIGHPLVFVTISLGIVVLTQLAPRVALSILAVLVLSVIVPTAILLAVGVRSGRWQDADVSVREQRQRFYPFAIPISAIGTLITWLIHAPFFIIRGGLVTLGLFIIAALSNFWFKISLHSLFATYCASILFRVNGICGLVALLLAALVAWSRLYLARHTTSEVVAGAGLGFLGGFVAAWWPS